MHRGWISLFPFTALASCGLLAGEPAPAQFIFSNTPYVEVSRETDKTPVGARSRATIASVVGNTKGRVDQLLGSPRVVRKQQRYKCNGQWITSVRYEYHYYVPGFRDVEISYVHSVGSQASPDAPMARLEAWPVKRNAPWRAVIARAGFSTQGVWIENKVRIRGLKELPLSEDGRDKWLVCYLFTKPRKDRVLSIRQVLNDVEVNGTKPEPCTTNIVSKDRTASRDEIAVTRSEPSSHETVRILNPSFEDQFAGWRITRGWTQPEIDERIAHSGTRSARLWKTIEGHRVEQDIPCVIPARSRVEVGFWMKMPEPGSRRTKWFTAMLYPTGRVQEAVGEARLDIFDPVTDWTYMKLVYHVHSPVNCLTIEFNTQNGDALLEPGEENVNGGYVWVDDVEVRIISGRY